MNKYDLEKATELDKKIEHTKNFKKALNSCRNHHGASEDKYVSIEINSHKQYISSVTYEKIVDLLDDEIARYENQFYNYLRPVDVSEKTDDELYTDAMSNLAQLAMNLKEKYNETQIKNIINSIALGIAGDKSLDKIKNIIEKDANTNLDESIKVFDV